MEPSAAITPLLLATALGAGLLSFVSPCVLPLVPAYLGFITGLSADELRRAQGSRRLKVASQAATFVLGLAAVFTILGASATALGQTLLEHQPLLLKVSGALVVVFGLHMLGIVRVPLLYRSARLVEPPAAGGGLAGSFALGLAFGAGWTPCIGPFLAGLLGLAASEQTVAQGMLLLLVYALGLGIPFLAAGLAVDRSLAFARALRPHLPTIERGSGVLLVGMGLLLFTERFTLVTIWLTRVFGLGLAR